MRSRARAALAILIALAATSSPARRANAESAQTIVLMADTDDDDVDGTPDGQEKLLPVAARADLVPIDASLDKATLKITGGTGKVRVWNGARLTDIAGPLGGRVALGAAFQGVAPGRVEIDARLKNGHEKKLVLEIRGVAMRDEAGANVDLARSHASLDRMPPAAVGTAGDTDALRAVLIVPDGSAALDATVESYAASGVKMDALANVALAPTTCPAQLANVHCLETAPLRFVVDDVDRTHPLVVDRSLRAEVGGAIVVRSGGRKQAIRVLGPRESDVGPIARYRLTVRTFVLRATHGGAPAIGGNDAGAVAMLRTELALASATWGQCGISFGDAAKLDVDVVDPPPRHLLSIGDDLGLPASGGHIRFRVDGKPVDVSVARGASVERVAHEVAAAIVHAGFLVTQSSNARILPGASGSIDLSVRRLNGTLASLDSSHGHGGDVALTTDATLSVRVGAVDPADGIEHFGDMDSMAGTLEERTLVKALDDGDPTTVELVVVPYFAGTGRIGESFITGDSPSMRNVVLLDRGGIRARRSSFTLAHELGHVLLEAPGHPDDYAIDTPTLLMDSDASDSSPFGPRRLTLAECARAIRQSGPHSPTPLLKPWPLSPLVLR
ncbi:MAG TPA: hypothetical protein VGH28_11585 [Polyangiaceae bacterium]|jgi:hypothetical protein